MVEAEASVTVARPAEDVFDFLSDLENDARWAKNWHSKRTSDGRALGAVYDRWYHFPFGQKEEAVVTVTAFDRPTRFGFESKTHKSVARVEFLLEPVGGGVRVTKREALDFGGVMGALGFLAGPMFSRESRKLLERLKRVLEEPAG